MAFNYIKKDISCYWKTELNGNNKQDKPEPEEKVLALNTRKIKQ